MLDYCKLGNIDLGVTGKGRKVGDELDLFIYRVVSLSVVAKCAALSRAHPSAQSTALSGPACVDASFLLGLPLPAPTLLLRLECLASLS